MFLTTVSMCLSHPTISAPTTRLNFVRLRAHASTTLSRAEPRPSLSAAAACISRFFYTDLHPQASPPRQLLLLLNGLNLPHRQQAPGSRQATPAPLTPTMHTASNAAETSRLPPAAFPSTPACFLTAIFCPSITTSSASACGVNASQASDVSTVGSSKWFAMACLWKCCDCMAAAA